MNEAIKKIIEGGKWQPIANASRDGNKFLAKTELGDIIIAWYDRGKYLITSGGQVSDSHKSNEIVYWMPLPDDRLANVLEIAVEALKDIVGQDNVNVYLSAIVSSSIQQIKAIVEGAQ